MPLMTKIRDNLGKMFLAAFSVAFIGYMVLDWGMDLANLKSGRGASDVVGKINGQTITYREFSDLLKRATDAQKKQTGQDPDDEVERQLRSQVWNTLLSQVLIDQEIDRLGIKVTDKEVVDLVRGSNPPESLVNMFRDSTGTFNRAAYDRALADPQNKEAWIQVEQQLRQQLRQEKLQSILFATVRATDEEISRRFSDQTISMEGEYVLFDAQRSIADSLLAVSDEDIERHYKANQDEFKVRPARRVKYVVFSNAPSLTDSADVLAEITRLKEQVATGSDFLDLAKTYSDIPATEAFYKHGELSRQKENAVFSSKKGDIVGPLLDLDGYHLLKIVDERKGKDEYVRASHILFSATGSDTAAVIQQARDVLKQIRSGADFGDMARKYGSDGTAPLGGDLGWGARGTWVKPFSDAAFRGRVGEVLGPVRTQFGWHLIKVTGRDNREVKLIDLGMKIKASSQSTDEAFQHAQDFVYLAKSEGFEKAADHSSFRIQETPEFSKGGAIPGLGFNDVIMNFAFSSSLDAISDPIGVSGGTAVLKLSAVREEGVRPLSDVKNIVRSMVIRDKKLKIVMEQADAFYKKLTPGVDLLTEALLLHGVSAQKVGPFKSTDAPQGVVRDLAFTSVAASLKAGEISKPFEGSRGYYIFKLLSKTPFDSALFAVQKVTLRDQVLQEKRSRFSSDWIASLREKASIEDHRDRFFR